MELCDHLQCAHGTSMYKMYTMYLHMLLNTRLLNEEYALTVIKAFIKTHFVVLEAVGTAWQHGVHAAQFGPTQGAAQRTVIALVSTAVPA